MNNKMSAKELVSLYNFLVTETHHAIARVEIILKAAPVKEKIVWSASAKHRAATARKLVEAVMDGEHSSAIDQVYRLYREANRMWGRCLTTRRKTIAALKRELIEAAEEGNLLAVNRSALLLAQLTTMTAADEATKAIPEIEIDWGREEEVEEATLDPEDEDYLPF